MFTSCSSYQSGISTLGSQSSFNDVSIPDDFSNPEDDALADMTGDLIEVTPPAADLPLQFKNTFAVSTQSYSLAHGPALKWDGCVTAKATQGGYDSDSKCGIAYFHPALVNNLNDAFYICISDAAQKAGLPQPKKVFVRHIGSYNDRTARNSTRLSNHAYARAWDIVNFNLYDQEGKLFKVSTLSRDYKNEQAQFYDEFRQCWKESMPATCKAGNTEYQGSIGHPASKLGGNTLHNDHLHLAYPLCAGNI
jgi:hypothetical protein